MIAYDSSVPIYFLESHPEFGKRAFKIIAESGRQGAMVSVLLQQEVLAGFALRSEKSVTIAMQALHSLENTSFLPVTKRIVDTATQLTLQYGKKVSGYDAVHLATALENGAEVFYTNDMDILSVGSIKNLRLAAL